MQEWGSCCHLGEMDMRIAPVCHSEQPGPQQGRCQLLVVVCTTFAISPDMSTLEASNSHNPRWPLQCNRDSLCILL